jgi:hypothetical protein
MFLPVFKNIIENKLICYVFPLFKKNLDIFYYSIFKALVWIGFARFKCFEFFKGLGRN